MEYKEHEEGYDIYTEYHLQWIHDNNLTLPTGDSPTGSSQPPLSTVSSPSCDESTNSSLSEVLALPKPVAAKRKVRKPALNAKANCITDVKVLEDLRQKKEEKKDEKEKEKRRIEREKRKEEREKKKKEKQEERERKKQEREEKRKRYERRQIN